MKVVSSNHFPSNHTSAAKSAPVTAEPQVHGSHSLENLTGFLLLMSEGLINALECAHGPEQANQVSGLHVPTASSFWA